MCAYNTFSHLHVYIQHIPFERSELSNLKKEPQVLVLCSAILHNCCPKHIAVLHNCWPQCCHTYVDAMNADQENPIKMTEAWPTKTIVRKNTDVAYYMYLATCIYIHTTDPVRKLGAFEFEERAAGACLLHRRLV